MIITISSDRSSHSDDVLVEILIDAELYWLMLIDAQIRFNQGRSIYHFYLEQVVPVGNGLGAIALEISWDGDLNLVRSHLF